MKLDEHVSSQTGTGPKAAKREGRQAKVSHVERSLTFCARTTVPVSRPGFIYVTALIGNTTLAARGGCDPPDWAETTFHPPPIF